MPPLLDDCPLFDPFPFSDDPSLLEECPLPVEAWLPKVAPLLDDCPLFEPFSLPDEAPLPEGLPLLEASLPDD